MFSKKRDMPRLLLYRRKNTHPEHLGFRSIIQHFLQMEIGDVEKRGPAFSPATEEKDVLEVFPEEGIRNLQRFFFFPAVKQQDFSSWTGRTWGHKPMKLEVV